jgi:hypothetical protein
MYSLTQHYLDEKGARGPQRGTVRPRAWFHATVVAYATDFDSTSATTAKRFTCRKGPAEPGIYEDDTKPGDVWRDSLDERRATNRMRMSRRD